MTKIYLRDEEAIIRRVVEGSDGLCLDVKDERERLIAALVTALGGSRITSPSADAPSHDPQDNDVVSVQCPACGRYTSADWIDEILSCVLCGADLERDP